MPTFSQTQLSILRSLAGGELTLADISRQNHLSKPNLSAQLAQLEKEGWITKRQESKKRIYYQIVARDYFERDLLQQQQKLITSIYEPMAPQGNRPKLVSGFDLYLTPTQRAYIEEHFTLIEYPEREEKMTPELFLLRSKDAEIALITSIFSFLDESMLRACKNLKHVIYMGKFASEYIDRELFRRHNIQYWDLAQPNTNFIRSSSVEFLIGSVLSILRPTMQAEQDIKFTGNATSAVQPQYGGEELSGKTVGIIGITNSAKFAAPILQQLGAKTNFADPDNTQSDPFDLGVERFYSVADLVATSDMLIYTDNYYKNTPRLHEYLREDMRIRYLLMLGEYPYDRDFMLACRRLLLHKSLRGVHLDYWSMRRYHETPKERLALLSEIMYFPNVRITPFLGPTSVQTNDRRNDYTVGILRRIKEQYYAD